MRRGLGISFIVLAALWIAPAADASTYAEAKLQAANGYRLQIDGLGGDVAVTAVRRDGGATYSTRGQTRNGELVVDLGRFGSVDLEFHADGRGWRGRPCQRTKKGIWTGAVQFVADGEFTSAFATFAKGRLTRFRPGCGAARDGARKRAPQLLTASYTDPDQPERFTLFTALAFSGIRVVSATRGYREDGIEVTSFANTEVDRSELRIDGDAGRALVRPGDPFSGSARFRADAGGRQRWRGDLSAMLPGAGTISLAGPRFRATLGAGGDATETISQVRRP